jgi:large subunit ribosomal protein L18Ae
LSVLFLLSQLKEYEIIGRRIPSEKNPKPQLYKMRIFAPDHIVAKSRFWYFLKKLKKLKKANGEIVHMKLVHSASLRNISYRRYRFLRRS